MILNLADVAPFNQIILNPDNESFSIGGGFSTRKKKKMHEKVFQDQDVEIILRHWRQLMRLGLQILCSESSAL